MLVVLVSVFVTIVGIVVMTSSIPQSNCAWGIGDSSIGIDKNEQHNIDRALKYVGLPTLVGGLVSLMGGVVGTFGGFKAHKFGICAEAALNGIAGTLMIFACLSALGWSASFASLCDDYQCGSTYACDPDRFLFDGGACAICKLPDVCCKDVGSETLVACVETVNWACDMKGKKITAMMITLVGAIFTILASSCGCGALCCCVESFTEMMPTSEPHTGNAPVVVGQPVQTNNEKE